MYSWRFRARPHPRSTGTCFARSRSSCRRRNGLLGASSKDSTRSRTGQPRCVVTPARDIGSAHVLVYTGSVSQYPVVHQLVRRGTEEWSDRQGSCSTGTCPVVTRVAGRRCCHRQSCDDGSSGLARGTSWVLIGVGVPSTVPVDVIWAFWGVCAVPGSANAGDTVAATIAAARTPAGSVICLA